LVDTSVWIEFFRKHEPYCYIAIAAASVQAQVATLDSPFQLLGKPAKISLYPLL
jgi:predicted nucleic acid-binding protein